MSLNVMPLIYCQSLVITLVCTLLAAIAAHASSMNETTCDCMQGSGVMEQTILPLKTTPADMNVSAGTTHEWISVFPSGSGYAYTTFSLDTSPSAGVSAVCTVLANKDHQLNLTFIAQVKHDGITISTIATLGSLHNISNAKLRVQGLLEGVGDLVSTMGPSNYRNVTQLHFKWTAPPTLQGVAIRGYAINITRHSDGLLLMTDTTNLTEYQYNTSSQQTVFTVAAINDVGVGNESNITVTLPIPTTCTDVVGSTEHHSQPTEAPTTGSTFSRKPPTVNILALSVGIILALFGAICLFSVLGGILMVWRHKRKKDRTEQPCNAVENNLPANDSQGTEL